MIHYVVATVAGAPLSFFLWAAVHEISHYAVLRVLRPSMEAKFFLYPHVRNESGEDKLFWARIEWEFQGDELSGRERFFVHMAPRLPDTIGVMITSTIVAACPTSPWTTFAAVLIGGSVIDMIVGLAGFSNTSDLRAASQAVGMSPWVFRAAFVTLLAACATFVTFAWRQL